MGKITAQRHNAKVNAGIDADLATVKADTETERHARKAEYRAAEAARVLYTKETLQGAEFAFLFGAWHRVARVNEKTITVYLTPNLTERYLLKEVKDRRP